MLDIYFDEKNIRTLMTRLRRDQFNDDYNDILKFLKKQCNLFVNWDFSRGMPKYLTLLTEGKGEQAKIGKFIKEENIGYKNIKPYSVFFLQLEDKYHTQMKERYACSVGADYDYNLLRSLLFLNEGQRKRFNMGKGSSGINCFSGWKDLLPDNLLPVSDVVILDQYFLRPGAYYDRFEPHRFESYIVKSFIPLIKVLLKKALGNRLNISVFTSDRDPLMEPEECCDIILNKLDQYIDKLGEYKPNITFSLVVIEGGNFGWHERYIYMNYQGIDTKLSIHGFNEDKVLGKKDKLSIYPYAEDVEAHENDLQRLEELSKSQQKKEFTSIYGDKAENRLLPKIVTK